MVFMFSCRLDQHIDLVVAYDLSILTPVGTKRLALLMDFEKYPSAVMRAGKL